MGTHFRLVCEDHGTVLGQCRCPGPKPDTKGSCPGPPICPQPGFRVTPCELSDDEALKAMHHAAGRVVTAALESRRDLLDQGFGDDHSLCEELDRTAAQYAVMQNALRHQAAAARRAEEAQA